MKSAFDVYAAGVLSCRNLVLLLGWQNREIEQMRG